MKKPKLPSPSRSTTLPLAALPPVTGSTMMEVLSSIAKTRDEISRTIAANARG